MPFLAGILVFATGERLGAYSMNRSLLLIAGWIGRALALQISRIRRPLSAEIASLYERLEKLRAENSLLRARLERIDPRKRPRFEPWERLSILWYHVRYPKISPRAASEMATTAGCWILRSTEIA